jgi:hypothetical protein
MLDDTRGSTVTNDNGEYTCTIDNQLIEQGCDIYLKIQMSNSDFTITDGNNTQYRFTTRTVENVKTSQHAFSYGESDANSPEKYNVLSINQAFNVGYYYYKSMNNNDTNSITVKYPSDHSSATSENATVSIDFHDYCDWDVILHELGHQASYKININVLLEGNKRIPEHFIDENLSERYGKERGIAGAWNEGWASYFSMSAQNYYNTHANTISSIYNVCDNTYTNLRFSKGDTTFNNDMVYRYLEDVGCGEANELAVTSILLCSVLDPDINLSYSYLWNTVKTNCCKSLSELVYSIWALNIELRSPLGILLEDHNVVDKPALVYTTFNRNTPGTFYCRPADTVDVYTQLGANHYTLSTRLVFWDSQYNIIYSTPFVEITTWNNDDPYRYLQLTQEQWTTLMSRVSGNTLYWCISSLQFDNPIGNVYYSHIVESQLN